MAEQGGTFNPATQEIISALSESLDEIERQDEARRNDPASSDTFQAFPVSDLADISAAQIRIGRIRRHPVRGACKNAIYDIGVHLHGAGGLALMRNVYDAVAYTEDGAPRRRANILDRTWDGIGSDGSGWWVA